MSISTYLYPIIAAHVLPAVAVFYDATRHLGQGKVCVYALRAKKKFSLLLIESGKFSEKPCQKYSWLTSKFEVSDVCTACRIQYIETAVCAANRSKFTLWL